MKSLVRKLNRYFLSDDPEEITNEDLFYWYGLFGGSVLLGLVVIAITF